jgi:methylmalonyl-CoA epimerase
MFRGLICASIAVNSIEESLPAYTEGMGLKLMGEIYPGKRGYGLRVAELGDGKTPYLELLDAPGEGPVRRFLETRGQGLYQIRLETDDLYETIKELQGRGIQVILPQPVGGGAPINEPGRDISIAFIHPRSTSGVLVELYPPQR